MNVLGVNTVGLSRGRESFSRENHSPVQRRVKLRDSSSEQLRPPSVGTVPVRSLPLW